MTQEQQTVNLRRPSLGKRWGSFRTRKSSPGEPSDRQNAVTITQLDPDYQEAYMSKASGMSRHRSMDSILPLQKESRQRHRPRMGKKSQSVLTTAGPLKVLPSLRRGSGSNKNFKWEEHKNNSFCHKSPRRGSNSNNRDHDWEGYQGFHNSFGSDSFSYNKSFRQNSFKVLSSLRRGSMGKQSHNSGDYKTNHNSFTENSTNTKTRRRPSLLQRLPRRLSASKQSSQEDATIKVNNGEPQSRDHPLKECGNEYDFDFYNSADGSVDDVDDDDDNSTYSAENVKKPNSLRRWSQRQQHRKDAELLQSPTPKLEEELLKRNDRRERRSSLKKKLLGNLSFRSLTGGNNNNDSETSSGRSSYETVTPTNSQKMSSRDINSKYENCKDTDILGTSFCSSVAPSHNLKDKEVLMLIYHELQMAMEQ